MSSKQITILLILIAKYLSPTDALVHNVWRVGKKSINAGKSDDQLVNYSFNIRQNTVQKSLLAGIFVLTDSCNRVLAAETVARQAEIKGYQTKSGLKYYDFLDGKGPSPRFGQLVSFNYICYFRPSSSDPLDVVDSSSRPFLHKHGNGRLIRAIDEGLHTMRLGGRRRIIVPKSIGYTELGLGPLPTDPSRRRRLGQLLDLVEADKGELVFDLELVLVADDENDQGYYDDEPVSQEDLRQIVLRNVQSGLKDEFLEKVEATTPPMLKKK